MMEKTMKRTIYQSLLNNLPCVFILYTLELVKMKQTLTYLFVNDK
jgi:hypothetical protein